MAATLDEFQTEYKRLGNRAVFDDRIIGPDGRLAPTMGWPQLMEILDAVPERVAPHPDGVAAEDVLAALRAVPGSMVVVRAAPPNEPQHVFALYSQPQKSGPPRIQVRDPLMPGAADRPEPDDPIGDPWLRHLFASSTRLAAFDGDGWPATITDLLGQTADHPQPITTTGTDTSALLLASTSTPRGPSQAMRADTTSTDPADPPRPPSDPAENDDPSGTGLAFIDQAFQNVVDPDLDRMDLDQMKTPEFDEDWRPGSAEQGKNLLNAFIVANPDLVRTALGARLPEDLQGFLSNPGRLQDQAAQMVRTGVYQGSELGRVAELLQDHVLAYLENNAGRLPADVTTQRLAFRSQRERDVAALSHPQVLRRLGELRADRVTDAGFLDPDTIRTRYDEVRATVTGGGVSTDVPQRQLDFINEHSPGFPVTVLSPADASRYLVGVLTDSDRQLDSEELATVMSAVQQLALTPQPPVPPTEDSQQQVVRPAASADAPLVV
ncbi:hypothetical protein V6U90_33165, partial [Micromonospora sp. CPCC 206060]